MLVKGSFSGVSAPPSTTKRRFGRWLGVPFGFRPSAYKVLNNIMKIIIIHPNETLRTKLRSWIEEHTKHAVLFDEAVVENLKCRIAQHEPDLVLLPTGLTASAQLVTFGGSPEPDTPQILFSNTLFLFLPESLDSLDWDDCASQEILPLIVQAEKFRRTINPCAHGYSSKERKVYHDEGFRTFAKHGKLHRPEFKEGWEKTCEQQEARFVLQLQAGTSEDRHQQAKRYLSILRRFDRGLQNEMAYRIGHGSYKVTELREQIGRWLTVIAHYIAGVELDHCPGPQNPSPHLGFVHHSQPMPYLYAVGCVMMVGINPAIKNQIIEATTWEFNGETDEEIAAVGCRLLGLNSFLKQVATAQVRAMDQFLDRNSEFHQFSDLSRRAHRHLPQLGGNITLRTGKEISDLELMAPNSLNYR